MDNATLEPILLSASSRNFWIKPVGIPGEKPDLHSLNTQPSLPVNFSQQPDSIEIGDILIVYRIMISKVIYVGEYKSLPREVTSEEIQQQPWKERWPWVVELRNLTPIYGGKWATFNLKPFSLVKEYNQLNPKDIQNLGSIQFGSDKLRVSSEFGAFILRKITRILE